MGYHRAGFEVTGVDNKPQSHYPFNFIRTDALEFNGLNAFDVIHASPPCQAYSRGTLWGKRGKYPDLVGQVREMLKNTGKPYVIENVEGAPLDNPMMICGSMFGLRVIRHRCFESNIWLRPPAHKCNHREKGTTKDGYYACVVGKKWVTDGVKLDRSKAFWSEAMGIDWMTKRELTQAIPPAYTVWIGKQLISYLEGRP